MAGNNPPTPRVDRRKSASSPIATLIYRSKSTPEFNPNDLEALVLAAQAKNAKLGVTGVVVFDDHRFLQWIEGPERKIETLFEAIRKDERHTDVEVLSEYVSDKRVFGHWSMQLAANNDVLGSIGAGDELRRSIHFEPSQAPLRLSELASLQREFVKPDLGQVREVISSYVNGAMGPRISAANVNGSAAQSQRDQVNAITDALLMDDLQSVRRIVQYIVSSSLAPEFEIARVFEATISRLSALWRQDVCGEVDITIATCTLLSALRTAMSAERSKPIVLGATGRSVISVCAPGDTYLLGPILNSEVLGASGWDATFDFPRNAAEFADILSRRRFDAACVSLSAVRSRDMALPALAEALTLARSSSLNSDIPFIVSGKIFDERPGAFRRIGADGVSHSALEVEAALDAVIDVQVPGSPGRVLH
ncbi:MAG: BLUF domain-containing protein [Pseudomonadota bacterium]